VQASRVDARTRRRRNSSRYTTGRPERELALDRIL
jgi:hypothetical protein